MSEDLCWAWDYSVSDLSNDLVNRIEHAAEHAYRRGFQQGVHEALRAAHKYGLGDWDDSEVWFGTGPLGGWLRRVSRWRFHLSRTTRVFHHPPYWENTWPHGATLARERR